MQRRLVSGLLVIVVLLLAGCVTDQAVVDVDEIYKNLLCTCGCTMPLNTCECGTAAQMQSEIGGMVDRGMTKQLILDAYVERHGQVILTSPPKAGFSLMAWVTPFLALAAGAVVLYAALRLWVFQGEVRLHTEEKARVTDEERQKYEERVDAEMRKWF